MNKAISILAHRGLYVFDKKANQNPFFNAIDRNYGIEIDIRNLDGRLVVSHDPLKCKPYLFFDQICKYIKIKNYEGYLAINVKEDNLENQLICSLSDYGINNWFTFDHSIPDLITSKSLKSFYRISEYETYQFYDFINVKGCWLDSFNSPHWYGNDLLEDLISKADLAIVSSELHGFSPKTQWSIIKRILQNKSQHRLFLCTDLPEEASKFFEII
tara:strand:+ start:1200 stop:1844 length:645 start_codon:yes stop_codon:yes gene_type:complete